VPPHNLDAEESVLGALLLSRDAVNAVAEMGLTAAEFYKPAHQHIYDAIRTLTAGGQPVDVVTVADELRRAGMLEELGGSQYLVELQGRTPAISNASRYAKIVQDTALARKLISVSSEIAEMTSPFSVVQRSASWPATRPGYLTGCARRWTPGRPSFPSRRWRSPATRRRICC
jgi:replicative DNA helicase